MELLFGSSWGTVEVGWWVGRGTLVGQQEGVGDTHEYIGLE